MFEPRITAETLRPTMRMARSEHDGMPPRKFGELSNPKDVADVEAWGHAVDAPTDDSPPRTLGMPPFTP